MAAVSTPAEPKAARDGVVVPFPSLAPEAPGGELEPAQEVVEGELLTDEESAALDARRGLQRLVPTRVVVLVVKAKESPSGTVVWRGAVGATGAAHVICQGFESWARRLWDASTMGVYRRQIKAAEALGDRVLLAEWIERKEHAAQARHKRLVELPRLAQGVVAVAFGGVVGVLVLLIVVGGVTWLSDAGTFLGPTLAALTVAGWVLTVVAVTWTPAVASVPLWVLLAAWREGNRQGKPPGWLATAGEADADIAIDETTIANALVALRIPQITAYLKQGLPLQYLTTARRDGRGTHAVLRLPAGVTAERIARRRADLATGLYRLAKEVWPTTGSEAGILDLWVADKGALAQGAGPYPLLSDGVTDVFKGVPFGKTLRGDPIMAPLMERNTITGGMPGQGKSSAARVVMLGAALDPTAELRIWIPDSNFDFEAFRPRCSRYVMGAETECIAEILAHLQELHEEVQNRGQLLVKYEEPQVTRALADKRIGLHPLFCLLEEAHVCIQHPEYGGEISQLLVDIVRLGRKRGIHVIVSTQAPTKDSMPRDVTRNCTNGIAFAVGDHVANDALLGQGAYAGGHRATELIPGTDIGTAVVKGFSGQRSEMVQAYFVSVAKGNDQVTPIIERSLATITAGGSGAPGIGSSAPRIEPPRDLLEDLDEALGDHPVPAADVPALLAQLAPRWAPYKRMTGKTLRTQLADHGVKVPSTGNRFPVDPVAVRAALARRSTADLDDE